MVELVGADLTELEAQALSARPYNDLSYLDIEDASLELHALSECCATAAMLETRVRRHRPGEPPTARDPRGELTRSYVQASYTDS